MPDQTEYASLQPDLEQRVLKALVDSGGATPSELAERLDLDESAVLLILERLGGPAAERFEEARRQADAAVIRERSQADPGFREWRRRVVSTQRLLEDVFSQLREDLPADWPDQASDVVFDQMPWEERFTLERAAVDTWCHSILKDVYAAPLYAVMAALAVGLEIGRLQVAASERPDETTDESMLALVAMGLAEYAVDSDGQPETQDGAPVFVVSDAGRRWVEADH
jgi:DNA-binding MarR family transcriptional regulator